MTWHRRSAIIDARQDPSHTACGMGSLPDGLVGEAYELRLDQMGITNPTWYVAPEELPEGLSVSEGGVLSGTPAQAGAYAIIVTVQGVEAYSANTISLAKKLTLVVGQTEPENRNPLRSSAWCPHLNRHPSLGQSPNRNPSPSHSRSPRLLLRPMRSLGMRRARRVRPPRHQRRVPREPLPDTRDHALWWFSLP